jgi:hypothetical protein
VILQGFRIEAPEGMTLLQSAHHRWRYGALPVRSAAGLSARLGSQLVDAHPQQGSDLLL